MTITKKIFIICGLFLTNSLFYVSAMPSEEDLNIKNININSIIHTKKENEKNEENEEKETNIDSSSSLLSEKYYENEIIPPYIHKRANQNKALKEFIEDIIIKKPSKRIKNHICSYLNLKGLCYSIISHKQVLYNNEYKDIEEEKNLAYEIQYFKLVFNDIKPYLEKLYNETYPFYLQRFEESVSNYLNKKTIETSKNLIKNFENITNILKSDIKEKYLLDLQNNVEKLSESSKDIRIIKAKFLDNIIQKYKTIVKKYNDIYNNLLYKSIDEKDAPLIEKIKNIKLEKNFSDEDNSNFSNTYKNFQIDENLKNCLPKSYEDKIDKNENFKDLLIKPSYLPFINTKPLKNLKLLYNLILKYREFLSCFNISEEEKEEYLLKYITYIFADLKQDLYFLYYEVYPYLFENLKEKINTKMKNIENIKNIKNIEKKFKFIKLSLKSDISFIEIEYFKKLKTFFTKHSEEIENITEQIYKNFITKLMLYREKIKRFNI